MSLPTPFDVCRRPHILADGCVPPVVVVGGVVGRAVAAGMLFDGGCAPRDGLGEAALANALR